MQTTNRLPDYIDNVPSPYYVRWPMQQTLPGFDKLDATDGTATKAAEDHDDLPDWKQIILPGVAFMIEFIGTAIAYTLGTLMLAAPILQWLIDLGIIR